MLYLVALKLSILGFLILLMAYNCKMVLKMVNVGIDCILVMSACLIPVYKLLVINSKENSKIPSVKVTSHNAYNVEPEVHD